MTYENPTEVEVLKSLWRPGAALENTLFAYLDPYGRALTSGARTPGFFYADSHAMAMGMDELARRYPGRGANQALPVVPTVRLGMNVAAADKLPLAIVVGDSSPDRSWMAKQLAPLSWRSDLIGALTYAEGTRNDLRSISGASISRGYVFVSPNEFGTGGTVVAQLNVNASQAELERALKQTIYAYRPSNIDHDEHVRMGHQQGVTWTSATPVTDPMSLRHDQMVRNGGGLENGFGGPDRGGPGRGPGGGEFGGGPGDDGPPPRPWQ